FLVVEARSDPHQRATVVAGRQLALVFRAGHIEVHLEPIGSARRRHRQRQRRGKRESEHPQTAEHGSSSPTGNRETWTVIRERRRNQGIGLLAIQESGDCGFVATLSRFPRGAAFAAPLAVSKLRPKGRRECYAGRSCP